jgi:lipopolysaccharide cholinephosphotransferase
MKELSLQEIKQIELDILKVFHSFCVENNIRYFISHGTLLGALRYKGFIPWDDDLDVLVPREDYDRLMTIFQESKRYRLLSYERNKAYRFPYAKLCDMTTRKVEEGYDNGVEMGLDIDVFPLDNWDDDLEKARLEGKRQKRNRFCLGLTKLEKPDSINPAKRFVKGIVMALCKFRGSAYYVETIIQGANKPEQKSSRYMGSKAWNVYGERDILPAEVFAEAIELEFEGEKFFAPVGYDTFLTSLYGDYLPEPPVEKRKTHHSFKAYRL